MRKFSKTSKGVGQKSTAKKLETWQKQGRGYYGINTMKVRPEIIVEKSPSFKPKDKFDDALDLIGEVENHLHEKCDPTRIYSLGDKVRARSYHATRQIHHFSYEDILELLKRDFKEHFETRTQKREISKIIGTMAEWEVDQARRCRYCN